MKTVFLAGALALTAAGTATAGGLAPAIEPVVTPTVVTEDAASSVNQAIIVPLMFLLLVAVAAGNS